MFERRLFFHVDWLLLGAVLLLAAIGVAMIYSTTYVRLPDGSGHAGREFWTQLYALAIGGIALLVCLTIDYRFLAEHSLFLYAGLLGLLLFVLVAGDSADGRAALDRARPVQVPAVRVRAHDAGADSRDVLRREPARRPQHLGSGHRRHLRARAVRADRQAAGPRLGDDPAAGLPRRRLPGRACGCGCWRLPRRSRSCSRPSPGNTASRTIRNPAS